MIKRIITALIIGCSLGLTAEASIIPQDFNINNGGAIQAESDLFFFRLDYPEWTGLLAQKLSERELKLADLAQQISTLDSELANLEDGPPRQQKAMEKENLVLEKQKIRESILLYLAEQAKTERDKVLLEERADREMLDPLIHQESGFEGEAMALTSEEYIMPTTGKETSPFGWRVHPVTQNRSLHQGIDLANQWGTPIRAAKSGIVTFSGYNEISGNNLLIRHYDGQETAYFHMDKLLVERGEYISQSQMIGLMGTTGRSTGIHLHFEIRINGVSVNPAPYIYHGTRWEVH